MFFTNYNQTITATTIGKRKPRNTASQNTKQNQILHVAIAFFFDCEEQKNQSWDKGSQQTRDSASLAYREISSHQDQWENKVKRKKRFFKLLTRFKFHKISIDHKLHIICPSACTAFIWRIKRVVSFNKPSHDLFQFISTMLTVFTALKIIPH